MPTVVSLYADRVVETTTTTGTGTITLNGVYVGIFGKAQTFASAFVDGTRVNYVIFNDTEEEVGTGIYSAGTLTREVVFQSSNADALVNLSAAQHVVFCDLPAQAIADLGMAYSFAQVLVPR